jgi:hypothetical protein
MLGARRFLDSSSQHNRIYLHDLIPLVHPALFPKIFPFPLQLQKLYPLHPALHEGRIAIVTDVGCGMRWMRQNTLGILQDSDVA